MKNQERALLNAATVVMTIAFEGRAGAFDIGDHIDSCVALVRDSIQRQESSPPSVLTPHAYKLVQPAIDIVSAFDLEPSGDSVAWILNLLLHHAEFLDVSRSSQ